MAVFCMLDRFFLIFLKKNFLHFDSLSVCFSEDAFFKSESQLIFVIPGAAAAPTKLLLLHENEC